MDNKQSFRSLFRLTHRAEHCVCGVLLALFTHTSEVLADAPDLEIDRYLRETQQSLLTPQSQPRVLRLKVSGRSDNLDITSVPAPPTESPLQSVRTEGLTQTRSTGAIDVSALLIDVWHRLLSLWRKYPMAIALSLVSAVYLIALMWIGGRREQVALNASQRILDALPDAVAIFCLLYTSPSPRDKRQSRMPSSA